MLIIGGTLAIAILALLAAFFLSRGDKKSKSTPAVQVQPAQPRQPTQPEIAQHATAPALDVRSQSQQLEFPTSPLPSDVSAENTMSMPWSEYRNQVETATTQFNEHPVSWSQASGRSVPAQHSAQDVAALNRQLYELAGQLHILQRQSRDIEQGLVNLSNVIERMDTPTSVEPTLEHMA